MASFIKSLERLSYAGFKVVDNTNDRNQETRDFKDVYKGFIKSSEKIQKQLSEFQNDIDHKEKKLKNIDYSIRKNKKVMKKMREKGFLVRFTSKYRARKRQLKYLKRQKKQIPKLIKIEYTKMKRKENKLKNIQKEFKKFEKDVKKLAKQYKKEINFILYCKKNKDKLEKAYSKEKLKEIEKYMERLAKGQKRI